MNEHPTPADIRYHVNAALFDACNAWEAETGETFPYVAAVRAVKAGISAAIAEHEAFLARMHNGRDAA